jgi:hypothetical protein
VVFKRLEILHFLFSFPSKITTAERKKSHSRRWLKKFCVFGQNIQFGTEENHFYFIEEGGEDA